MLASLIPGNFLFQLTQDEQAEAAANCDHLRNLTAPPKSPKRPIGFLTHVDKNTPLVSRLPKAEMARPVRPTKNLNFLSVHDYGNHHETRGDVRPCFPSYRNYVDTVGKKLAADGAACRFVSGVPRGGATRRGVCVFGWDDEKEAARMFDVVTTLAVHKLTLGIGSSPSGFAKYFD